MKTKWSARPALAIFLILLVFSCRKTLTEAVVTQPIVLTDSIQTKTDTSSPFPQTFTIQCVDGPDYGDSIVYAQPPAPGSDYIINPSNPGLGTYLSWPKGMMLDAKTGAINISKSVTGLRYYIGFVRTGSKDTCVKQLVLAGSSYMDSVYTVSNGNTKASPYFNANPNMTSVCGQTGACRFDISHKGFGRGVNIDPETGVMDLEKTQDIFGSHPFNGEFVDVNMDYSLGDKSNNAIQQLSLRFIYFNKNSQIPQWLLDIIAGRRNNTMQDVPIVNDGGGNPKPTLIVITRAK